MSERWKYQIKNGGLWGIIMIVPMVLFRINEKTISEQISSPKFYLRVLVYLAIGIFLIGYINWKAKVKSESTK
ncbi:hypothetical protein [Flavobacterium sp. GT3R68]|uniref:hypothetical protein n=1 Tax=Flavobacterium sp. GT3R68 TaxID=2594437 RepID=UPI000F88E9AE|nr:hypothetical protein [Flavobacterium sp. GT3R68]RTY95812.1 hypothetical protein EKL32_03990 [Flavobacterium sp. GSN2]TRW93584.1 hypothetical protein FNW07_01380 [Flavobacterium sp. GT3R68]